MTTIGYRHDDLAPFFRQPSGIRAEMEVTTFAEIAAVIKLREQLNWRQGALVSIPVDDQYRIDKQQFVDAVHDLVARAEVEGVSGPQVTNWMVGHLARSIGPNAFKANTDLLGNNAAAAARIGIALAGGESVDD